MYQVTLALHIIFVVTWFAGLFYIVRLFVYHAEAESKTETERAILIPQYRIMEKRLWYGITWPSMILTVIFGSLLLYQNTGILYMAFMLIKLVFVAFLIVYHLFCHRHFKQLQQEQAAKTGNFYRILNEVPTLFLVAIIFLIILRDEFNWIYGVIGFFTLGIALMLAIKIYKRIRTKRD